MSSLRSESSTTTTTTDPRLQRAEQKINEALRNRPRERNGESGDLVSRVVDEDEKVPQTMTTLASINLHLLSEMRKLRRLISLADVPSELKERLSAFISAMTNFRTGSINLVLQMQPTVQAVITGLEEYDEDSSFFDTHIQQLLRAENLKAIQDLMTTCIELLQDVRQLHLDINTVKTQVKGAHRELSESLHHIGAMYATAAVSMWATFSVAPALGLAAAAPALAAILPEIPVLFAATAIVMGVLGVYCWWNWKEVNDALTDGETAIQEISLKLQMYEEMLLQAQHDLAGIQNNWQGIDSHSKGKKLYKIRRDKLLVYCENLNKRLQSLYDSCADKKPDLPV